MKKYVITGSLGHISRPVVIGLVNAGKDVKVITSKEEKVDEIEALGAKALVGLAQDKAFTRSAFKGAEVVYTMIPPIWQTNNWRASQFEIAESYTEAIKANGVKYAVNLSSIGVHMGGGVGPVDGMYDFEQLLDKVGGLNVKHLRPSSFFNNLLAQIDLIKQAGIMGANYGSGDQKMAYVHTDDIAIAAIEELLNLNFKGSSVRYILSDVVTSQKIVDVIGKSIDRQIAWVVFSDEEQKQGLLNAGLSETHASAFTEMGAALRSGRMQEEVLKFAPAPGSVKLEDFASEFSAAYGAVTV